AVSLAIEAREIAADRLRQPVEAVGEETFQIENVAHRISAVDSYKIDGYRRNQIASTQVASTTEDGDGLFLHAGLRQRLRDGNASRFTAAGHELSAAARLRALCRAALRLPL